MPDLNQARGQGSNSSCNGNKYKEKFRGGHAEECLRERGAKDIFATSKGLERLCLGLNMDHDLDMARRCEKAGRS